MLLILFVINILLQRVNMIPCYLFAKDELGKTLEAVCMIVPAGSLVFFPSYKLMEKLCDRWRETGQWSRLNARKTLFVGKICDVFHCKVDSQNQSFSIINWNRISQSLYSFVHLDNSKDGYKPLYLDPCLQVFVVGYL